MASIRVTQQLLVDRVLNNLSASSRRLLRLQDQLATGQRVNQPSDDPLAARRALNARAEIARNEQYLTNISTISPGLQATETSILTMVDLLQRVRELTLQGSNGANSQLQRDQIATEINQLLEQAVVQGNTVSNGRHVFGGTRTTSPAFTPTRNPQGEITAVAYAGNDEEISIEISDGVRVVSNLTGQDVFLANADTFQMLISIRDNLRAGNLDGLQSDLQTMQTVSDQFLAATARIGATTNRVEQVDATLRTVNIQLTKLISDNIDADFAEVTINLNLQSNVFTAALQAGARVIQPSLLDFLR